MEEPFFDLVEFLKKPSITETFVDILLCAVPIWLAVMIGLVIGWSWRPRWTGLVFLGLRSKFRFLWTAPPGFGARRLWLAVTALSAFSLCRTIWSNFRMKSKGPAAPPSESETAASTAKLGREISDSIGSDDKTVERKQDIVTLNDLEHLFHLVEGRDGEMEWQNMMERSTQSMSYQAWRHEPETGPIVYRSRTVFEDATPELVRDFFWDDDFRPKWDPMLAYFKILDECPDTGSMIVHWIKKFPFFCSDREYIIGRRIWESGSGKTYYCVTKGMPYPGLPKRDKPRRVELYFSSWIIKAVKSRKGDGQLSACEVTLLHYEDMGIPKDVAKLGVRHGMWGAVKKLHSGMRGYQNARKSEVSLSRFALMARITTKFSLYESIDRLVPVSDEEETGQAMRNNIQNDHGFDWKWVVLGGGAVALVCGLHSGVIGKALLLGAGQRIARR
ncbi:StAR-related lipid transfer protein like [Quillaja saponaria]|uniref:StAR-related lipid transfer protein like n=1 Tax=Quillaja saponaria TaxID=32244 RepID=A0AAD7LAW0_QUISA|nr:StAR-related lipid transfer protein like [Quillaja saponaria]